MRKFFLIPLMTMMCSVMAFATTVYTAGTFAELQDALTAAVDGDEIQLTADFGYPTNGSGIINITKSVTIDGQNHTLSGYGSRNGNKTTIAINQGGANFVAVTLKDLTIRNAGSYGRPIECRGKMTSLSLNNVKVYATGSGNCQGITIGGNQATAMTLNMTNSLIDVTQRNQAGDITKSGSYAIISFNPYNATIDHCTFSAWAGLYFKGISSSAGSRGSVVNVENTAFHCSNYNSGETNSFGGFVCEDDGITITATNCTMESSALGDQAQAVLLASGDYIASNRRTQPISLTLAGDNTRIIMDGAYYGNIDVKAVKTFDNNTWYKGGITWGSDDYIVPFSVTMTGGTYDVNPMYYRHVTAVNRDEYGQPIVTEDGYSVVAQSPIIPAGYAIVTVKDGDKTLYRVTKSDISYNINGNYEEEGAGDNPTTSFIVEAASADETIELVNNATEASYVQVRDNADGDAVTLAVGKMDGENKVNQTLVVNNGLDVQGNSQVTVQPGSTLQIGEGGIVTEKPENIVIEANEEGAASLIMDPTITVNQTPNLTVRMTAKQIGRNAQGDFYWHRFAMPVDATITSWDKEGTLVAADPENYTVQYPTYIYGWNYAENKWKNLSGVNAMVPLQGYTITLASDYIHVDGDGKVVSEGTQGGNLNEQQDVVYTFKGNLVGNTDQKLNFQAEGFNFFGNSYTGYMDVLKLIEGIESDNVEGTVYMWCNDPDDEDGNYQSYVGVPLYKLSKPTQRARLATWQQEVAPMQTFILRLRGADSADESINYASAIWGNPRYGNNSGSGSGAPRRRVASINEDTYMEIAVKAANGKGSRVDFTESANNSDDFESGYDVVKYMNENSINLYATINGEDFSSVVTNNIVGKTLSLKTNGEIVYTMSFKNVEGEEYAIRDNATGAIIAIEEGATYEFAAQPNSTIEGRFEIVSRADAPTAIENTEVKANVKGIYTILGQYLGENFDILPAGVYVVDGVKIVK